MKNKLYDKIRFEDSHLLSNIGPFHKGYNKHTSWNEVWNTDIHCMMIDLVFIDYIDGKNDKFAIDDIDKFLIPEEWTNPPQFYGLVENCCNYD